jgi:hypothetical protein
VVEGAAELVDAVGVEVVAGGFAGELEGGGVVAVGDLALVGLSGGGETTEADSEVVWVVCAGKSSRELEGERKQLTLLKCDTRPHLHWRCGIQIRGRLRRRRLASSR